MEQYYKFVQNERKDIISFDSKINNFQQRKNVISCNKMKSNVIGNIGSNIVNSVKQNKNFLIADVGNEEPLNGNRKNNNFNTPQRSHLKFSLNNNEKENINDAFNKDKKKYFKVLNHNVYNTPNFLSAKINNSNNYLYPLEENYYSNGYIPTHNYLILDEDSIYPYLNFVSIFLEIESNIDNRLFIGNHTSKYLDTYEKFFMIHKSSFDIFFNENLNKCYHKILKFSLILMFLMKTNILHFSYDYNSKVLIKRYLSFFIEILCIFFDYFFFSDISKNMKMTKKDLIDKVQRISRTNCSFFNRKNKMNEVTSYLYKLFDNYSSLLKNFSLNYFKLITPPFHTAFTDLINLNEKIKIEVFSYLVIKNLIYGMIRKEESINIVKKQPPQSLNEHPPYLPVQNHNSFKYTLVLDLDETIVHFFFTPNGGTFFIRPYALEFMQELSKYYELVIFTAATQDYADAIIDLIDIDFSLIKYRLYRNHISVNDKEYIIKDLSLLGRDLRKTIIIDNIAENFDLQPNNGLISLTWKDNIFDTQLLDFKEILMYIYQNELEDVTEIIKYIKSELNKFSDKEENNYPKIDIKKFK